MVGKLKCWYLKFDSKKNLVQSFIFRFHFSFVPKLQLNKYERNLISFDIDFLIHFKALHLFIQHIQIIQNFHYPNLVIKSQN